MQLSASVQTLKPANYEVLVADDGSHEPAEAMIRRDFPWVRWMPGPRRGPAANRNRGASAARGEWLVFTDDDCVPSPGWLEAYAAALHPDIAAYEGKTTCESGLRSPLEHAPINLNGGALWSCNMMISRRLFQEIGAFDAGFPFPHMEDAEFKERVDARTKIKFVAAAVVDHPPRRLPSGTVLARHQECRVYFDQLHRKQTSLVRLLTEVARSRWQAIRRHRFSVDSLRALASLAAEVFTVTALMPAWKRKYRLEERGRIA